MVVAYLTSRFPDVSQTWMLREMDAVMSDPDVDCELLTLFRPKKRMATVVHPAAKPWLPRLRRPGPVESLAAVAWWLHRSPGRLLASVAIVMGAYARRPMLLVRALVTVAISTAHARWLANREVDHLHAHTGTYPVVGAWLCHRLMGISYSFTPHGQDLYRDQSFLRQRLAAADFAVAISHFNRGFLAAYGGDRVTPVHLVRCGIDLSAYRFRPRAPEQTGPVRALCIGSLKDPKGHEFLFEALASGGPELERVRVDLAGDGPRREELKQLVHTLGLDDRVTFHGPLPEPAVIALLDRADMFVLQSVILPNGNTEGLPVVLMEALASGVPVVATRVTAIPELIRDGETGLLAEPGSSSDLRRAIARVLADPAAARRRAVAGRALVEQNHDARRSGALLARLFRGDTPFADDDLAAARAQVAPGARGAALAE